MTIREQAILICDIAASDVYKAEDAHGDWSRATDAEAAQLLRDGFRPG